MMNLILRMMITGGLTGRAEYKKPVDGYRMHEIRVINNDKFLGQPDFKECKQEYELNSSALPEPNAIECLNGVNAFVKLNAIFGSSQ